MWLLVFTAFALSADGLAAGVALGLRGVRIRPAAQAAVGLLSMGFAAAAVGAGAALRVLLGVGAARWPGALLLVLLGGASLWKALRPPAQKAQGAAAALRDPAQSDLDHSGSIDLREALLLGLSLSLDMLSAGVGLALGSGLPLLLMPPAAGLAQVLCLTAGACCGRRLRRLPVRRALLDCLSGVLLVALGLLRLFF